MDTLASLIKRKQKHYEAHEVAKEVNLINFNKKTRKIISIMNRDGYQCDCCGASDVIFELRKPKNKFKFLPFVRKNGKLFRMTLDHNILDCLKGGNETENMTALCEECNALRQHKFAEYKEFKYWYHNSDRSITPDVNYCFVEFKKNMQDTYILSSMSPIKVFPVGLFEVLKRDFKRGGIDVFKHTEKGTKHFESECMSTALCKLIQIYMKSFIGVDNARLPVYTFCTKLPEAQSLKEYGILFNEQIFIAIAKEIKYYTPSI